MMIILLILITLSLDSVWILLGENCCWSLLAFKGLMYYKMLLCRFMGSLLLDYVCNAGYF